MAADPILVPMEHWTQLKAALQITEGLFDPPEFLVGKGRLLITQLGVGTDGIFTVKLGVFRYLDFIYLGGCLVNSQEF